MSLSLTKIYLFDNARSILELSDCFTSILKFSGGIPVNQTLELDCFVPQLGKYFRENPMLVHSVG